MPVSRSLARLALAVSLAGCASAPARHAAVSPEITFDLTAPPARARDQLAAAFAANGLPVATSQPGVVEFHAARERGVLGYYEVFVRALIVPHDCGARITMFGEETRYPNATSSEGTATRIGPSSTGRAREIWTRLQSVASALHADTAATTRTDR